MQTTHQGVVELLVLSGIDHEGHLAWIFVPSGWDISRLERKFPFSGHARASRRRALVTVQIARELMHRYGTNPVLELPGKSSLADLLSDDLSGVRMLISRD
ncbi:MAG: hypothetical protein ABS43_01035 [Bordetella sp. SCN 67-23]|nr:hypothetical protein [Burkholderiales bacterium]ODS76453.1 MAG: hypothetical protein ABS43_01035 [Bordetella sp. SCN 67-23]ODU86343.1 MAG: hypothetical protein ABT00_08915 [Bordetella sp. SCN 68-11]OJW86810.1 MAG: hypothetical protein BGO71_26070 [Burkholderiales bacterium 67-32]